MKLQKASRYALFAVLHLASEPEKQFSTAEIADSYGVSIHHLAKVMRTLVRCGLIESVRGVGGGYRFSGNVRRTTLWDVIHEFESLESDIDTPETLHDKAEIVVTGLDAVMNEIDGLNRATLDSITLKTLL
ncbi:MAG: Rrf2 family transcriptional regulator, partial [Gammaproteobacteria bacterium]|nr:Rrf2 family transcriptional regulator [Gammaproteobacteria bacterium]